jgi:hypothetical protein
MNNLVKGLAPSARRLGEGFYDYPKGIKKGAAKTLSADFNKVVSLSGPTVLAVSTLPVDELQGRLMSASSMRPHTACRRHHPAPADGDIGAVFGIFPPSSAAPSASMDPLAMQKSSIK